MALKLFQASILALQVLLRFMQRTQEQISRAQEIQVFTIQPLVTWLLKMNADLTKQFDQIEKQQEHLKNNQKTQSEYIQTLDKRLVTLESAMPDKLNFINWRLQSMENTLGELTKKLDGVLEYLHKHQGKMTAKRAMWFFIFSLIASGTALGLHKLLGLNI